MSNANQAQKLPDKLKDQPKKKRFNVKKWRDLTIFGVFSLLVIASNQNCAPAGKLSADGMGASSSDSAVGVIDPVKKDLAVSFAMKEVQLNSGLTTVSLEGKCSATQDGSVLGWEVRQVGAIDNEVFATGDAVCSRGKFQVRLAPTQNLDCGKAYTVKARLGFGDEGVSILTRACPL
jgi:hypothetical protein